MEYTDIIPGKTYRFRNSAGEERERTVVSADKKQVVYSKAGAINGSTVVISTSGFIRAYKLYGVKER